MNIGSTYAQTGTRNVYAPKRNSVSLFDAEDMGMFENRTKTMRIKTKGSEQIIKFNPYTLEVYEITTPDEEKKSDPVYKKLKDAGLIEDEDDEDDDANSDDSFIGTVRWHYEKLLAMKKARETVVKIEEDQLEELFDRMEHNTGEELSTEGVTASADTRTDADSDPDTDESIAPETEDSE